MKQKSYRVTLYPQKTELCKDIALLACLSNGSDNRVTLRDMESHFKNDFLKYPTSNEGCQCTVSNHQLTIDKKIDGRGVCLLLIEEVELFLMNEPTEQFSFSVKEDY
jgi:hypothetical protein